MSDSEAVSFIREKLKGCATPQEEIAEASGVSVRFLRSMRSPSYRHDVRIANVEKLVSYFGHKLVVRRK